ncbi:phosphotransferase [Kocuria sabuli]|uniref:phosphotransferase n=1 Tax=Kocuria sabuli TaxID=3071448 RepID=UPI0034D4A168
MAQDAPEKVPVFERVVGMLPGLQDQLGLGQFLGALALDHKPRVLYRFLVKKDLPIAELGHQVVLKVYGDGPRGEGPIQQLWRARGVNVPRLACGEEIGCSWLVMEYLDLHPVMSFPVDELQLVDQLARMAKTMHRPAHGLAPVLRPLDEVMVPRWKESVVALGRSGLDIPSTWLSRAVAGYTSAPAVPLHGDLAPANMGTRGGSLILFDASALYGTSCFDAARWSARTGPGGTGPEALFRRWMSVEGLPTGRESWELLAAECVLEAGSREIIRSRAAQEDPSLPHEEVADGVPELLAVASRLWS